MIGWSAVVFWIALVMQAGSTRLHLMLFYSLPACITCAINPKYYSRPSYHIYIHHSMLSSNHVKCCNHVNTMQEFLPCIPITPLGRNVNGFWLSTYVWKQPNSCRGTGCEASCFSVRVTLMYLHVCVHL